MVPKLRFNYNDVGRIGIRIEQFLPITSKPRNFDHRQGLREPIPAYTTAMVTLMMQRGPYDHERIMGTLN